MQSRTQLLTPSALRLDSRFPLELRSLSFEILPAPPASSSSTSTISTPPAHADGYAVASHGLTTVSSSVFGPREAQRTGAWSGGAGQGSGAGAGGGGGGATAGGAQKGDRAQVNVEVGIAGWAERVGQGAANEGGVRRAGKDRCVIPLLTLKLARGEVRWTDTPFCFSLSPSLRARRAQADNRDCRRREKHVRTGPTAALVPAEFDRHLPPGPRERRL